MSEIRYRAHYKTNVGDHQFAIDFQCKDWLTPSEQMEIARSIVHYAQPLFVEELPPVESS